MQNVLVEKIADRSITLNDMETCQKLIRKNSANFDLIATYADFLFKRGHSDLAIAHYENAENGYIQSGNLLKSVMMALKRWHIRMPDKNGINIFLNKLDCRNFNDSSFKTMLDGLSKAEKLAVFSKLKIEYYSGKSEIKKLWDVEMKLCFVASGMLNINSYEAVDAKSRHYIPPVRIISEGECFGQVYPFTETKKFQSIIETLGSVELAILQKEDLRRLSFKYPGIEKAIIKVCGIRLRQNSVSEILLRKHYRYPVNVKMKIGILAKNDHLNGKLFTGFSKDVSMGGIGFVADEMDVNDKCALSFSLEKNLKIRVEIIFHNERISVRTIGAIVRLQEIIENGAKAVILGIEFAEMAPNLQGLIFSIVKTFGIHSETGA